MDFSYIINEFKISERKGYLDVSLPIIMDMSENNCNLILTIKPTEDGGYVVYSTSEMFSHSGYSAEKCYNNFAKDEKNCTYGIKYEGGKFIRTFGSSDNPVFALDSFVKFFVAFNEFVMNSDIWD